MAARSSVLPYIPCSVFKYHGKKVSRVQQLPLVAEFALMLLPGTIHTLLTLVSRLWVVLVLHYNKCSVMHKEFCSLLDVHSPGKFITKASDAAEIALPDSNLKAQNNQESGRSCVETNNSICCQIPQSASPHLTSSALQACDRCWNFTAHPEGPQGGQD